MVVLHTSPGPAGTGSQINPFNSLSAVAGTATGDTIFLKSSGTPYSGSLTLLNSQKVVGQGAPLLADAFGAPSPKPGNASPAPTSNIADVTINSNVASGNTITLGSGNNLAGFTVGQTNAGFAISG